MKLTKAYTDHFSLETARTKEDVLERIRNRFKSTVITGDRAEIFHHPSPFYFFAGRGKTIVDLSITENGSTMIFCQIHPGLLHPNANSLLVLVTLAALTFGLFQLPISIFTVLGFITVWVIMAITAPFLLMLILVAWTMLVAFDSGIENLMIVGAVWVIFFYLIHLLVAHNKKQLRYIVYRFFRHMKD
jgi:hypothetical protein